LKGQYITVKHWKGIY